MAKNKGKYLYLLLYPCEGDKAEYDAITLGNYDTDEEAIERASISYYKISSNVLVVRTIAKTKCTLEPIKYEKETSDSDS